MSLLMGNRWRELCLFFNGYYFSTDYKKYILHFPAQAQDTPVISYFWSLISSF